MTAYLNGAAIEVRHINSEKYNTCLVPVWDWSSAYYRVKVTEYEYPVGIYNQHGNLVDRTQKYYTEKEFNEFGFPVSCSIIITEARIR